MSFANSQHSLPRGDRDDDVTLIPPGSPTLQTSTPGLALPGVELELERIKLSLASADAALASLKANGGIAGWAVLRAQLRRIRALSNHLDGAIFSCQQNKFAPTVFGATSPGGAS